MSTALTRFRFCTCAILAAASLRAEPAVIGLARAYLGPDSTLDGITSVHFVGAVERQDPDHPEKGTLRAKLDMLFVKPFRQRQMVRADKISETTVLDGYDAWERLQDNADPAKFRMRWLGAGEIKALRANTWENLSFFRGLQDGGAVEDVGPTTVDGIACERVDFTHGPGIDFERFFDRDTGRLVMTVSGAETIREDGEIRVEGIRFPKAIVSVSKTATGKQLVSTVTFDSIALNEPVGPETFAVPGIPSGAKPAVSPPGK